MSDILCHVTGKYVEAPLTLQPWQFLYRSQNIASKTEVTLQSTVQSPACAVLEETGELTG